MPIAPPPAASTAPERVRMASATGTATPTVDRSGGRWGAGLVRGFAVISRGEALGRDEWIDEVFLRQVHDAMRAAGARGVKSRFTHPGLSGDGLGKHLGRALGPSIVDGRVMADLHLARSAHDTPEGDLAGYLMDRAEEDPESFGASIVYWPDFGAQSRFVAEHGDEDGRFVSPDPLNEKNLPHARLARLDAVDVVGDPAANEAGFFSRGSALPAAAEQALAFALGLTAAPPADDLLGIHPERIKAFMVDFLGRNGLEVVRAPAPPAAGKDRNMAELNDVTLQELEAERPDLAGQLRAEGAEEAEKKLAAGIEAAKTAAAAEALSAERARVRAVRTLAAELELPADDEAVAKALDDGLAGAELEISLKDRKLALLRAAAPGTQGADADPEAEAAERRSRAASAIEGLTASEAWERNARLPDGECSEMCI